MKAKLVYPLIIRKKIIGSRLTISIHPELKKKLIKDDFWIEIRDTSLDNIPDEILFTPFILNIAPVIWVSGYSMKIDKMDARLFESLKTLKEVFRTMYPSIEWPGEIIVETVVDVDYLADSNKACLLFSGGVDSVTTSCRHLDQEQAFVTIRGSDVSLDDESGWFNVQKATVDYAATIGASYFFVESNFLDFLNHEYLNKLYNENIPDWWAYVQHGMGLTGIMAVPAYVFQASVGYIASSHSYDYGDNPWGSAPSIDNNIYWAKFNIQHDGYEWARQKKLEFVVSLVNTGEMQAPFLRVCYSSRGGKNCCSCEKCCRTITGLIVANSDYRMYGFPVSESEFIETVRMKLNLKIFDFNENALFQWTDLQMSIKPNSVYRDSGISEDMLNYIEWIRSYDFKSYTQAKLLEIKRRQKIIRLIKKIPGFYALLKSVKNIVRPSESIDFH